MVAQNLAQKISQTIDAVCVFPDPGRYIQNEYEKKFEVRRVLIDHYILYYKQVESTIFILRILYAKRDLNDVLKKIEIVD